MTIRPLRDEDHDAVVALARRAFAGITMSYKLNQKYGIPPSDDPRWQGDVGHAPHLARRVKEEPNTILVTEVDGRVVGYISYGADREKGLGTVMSNGVEPEMRGRGIGTAQVRAVLDIFRREGLSYATVQTGLSEAYGPARRAYEKAGFEPIVRSVRYYMRL